MADLLTHLFLPLTAAFVLFRPAFRSPVYLLLGGFGVLSDFDKYLGMPGLLHSLLTLLPLVGLLIVFEWWRRDETSLSLLIGGFILSHLVLDFVDGGPVPLLYPIIERGIGIRYPARVVFGVEPLGIGLQGPVLTIVSSAPRGGFNTYGFIDGVGIANALLFFVVFLGLRWQTDHQLTGGKRYM